MHVYDLATVAEDRRVAREREGRLERIVRRTPAPPAPVRLEKVCTGAQPQPRPAA